jgi:5-methylcytosine-specific restriction endonuclease McrA
MKSSNQSSPSLSRDLNLRPPEYKAEVPATRTRRSIHVKRNCQQWNCNVTYWPERTNLRIGQGTRLSAYRKNFSATEVNSAAQS